MQFKHLFNDEDAVSPVIGVILMVAITVILAAVIGTFVLGLGDQVSNTSPSASFTFDLTDNAEGTADELDVTHDGGDKITASQVSFAVSGATASDGTNSYDVAVDDAGDTWADLGSNPVTAGSTVTITDGSFHQSGSPSNVLAGDYDGSGNGVSEHVDLEGATVRVTWQSSNGGDTATLGKWSGPDA